MFLLEVVYETSLKFDIKYSPYVNEEKESL